MRSEKEKMLQEDLYRASDPELIADDTKARRLTRLLNQTTEEEIEERIALTKEIFGETGDKIYVEPPFRCDYGKNVFIGEHFYANFDCVMLDVAKITIGKNVMFGPRVCLFTAGHPIDAIVRNSGLEFGRAITIEDNVWIGGNTTVNPGVTIGENVIIGSGSVVTKDIPANTIAAGNPCRVIREITQEDEKYWQEKQSQYWAEIEQD